MVAPKGYMLNKSATKFTLSDTDNGFAILSATIIDRPENDPVRYCFTKERCYNRSDN